MSDNPKDRDARFRVLLTGAASLVGAELLKELLSRTDIEAILLLMSTEETSRSRDLRELKNYLGPLPPYLTSVAGDLRLPRFGFSLADWEMFTKSFNIAFHCAQREIPDQNLEAARQENVRSVETFIQLLSHNPELRLHYLSTGFVGGVRRGLFTEFDLNCGQDFHNAWERSKFEAESLLRECQASDRITIYRPSHILGVTGTGDAFQLGGAYSLLASLAAAWIIPGDRAARIDFVPVDYVASAMAALAFSRKTGTYHLVSSWNASLPIGDVVKRVSKIVGRARSAFLVPKALAWILGLAGIATLKRFTSRKLAFRYCQYLLGEGPVFDDYKARSALTDLGVAFPKLHTWLETVVQGAEESRWRRPPRDDFEKPIDEAHLPTAATEAALLFKNPAFREKRFHQVGDVKLAYRDIGEGEPVIFFHGFAGAHAWDGVAARTAMKRRAIIVETLGISDSEAPGSADFGLPAQAARVRSLMSALDISSAHIVGNDTGGVIAQFFAVRWPHCVRSLMLSDCDAHGTWPPTHVAWIAALMRIPGGAAALITLMRIPALARSSIGLGRMVYDKRLLTRERINRYLNTVGGNRMRRLHFKRFFRSFDRTDLNHMNHLLREIQAPTIIIWGADNAYWSPSWAKTLYDAIPGARRLELIPFAGISCHEERPDLFARILDEFFDDIENCEQYNPDSIKQSLLTFPKIDKYSWTNLGK
jgi:pimeloyl-ACP methyl ester carboxylesterase/thioester reductase-like protein